MQIQREIIKKFTEWKNKSKRKPILLKGARQIGKTWAMEQFGKEQFEYYVKFDFDKQPELKSAFVNSKEPKRIIEELAIYSDVPLIAGRTLIIFDEIQECEEALNSLKYFCEDAPEYHVIAAGTLMSPHHFLLAEGSLGVAVKKRKMTVPVGKVQMIRMYPVSFYEYLRESDRRTFDYVDSLDEPKHLPEIVLNKLTLEYRRYMICGGMPEAAAAMLDGVGMQEIDSILQGILDLYELDFAKYAEPREIPRIHAIWHSLPSQLSKENRKFIYKVIKTGARSKDYEDALLWLEDAGMIYRIKNITKPGMPLSAYEDLGAFKVYSCDCGLLRRLARLPASVVNDPTANYTEFKGGMAENAVLESLMPLLDDDTPYYWSPESKSELEFIIQWRDEIIPIEVKAENCVSGRSIVVYNEKYAPKNRIRFSFLNLQYNCGMLSCPAPLAAWFPKWIQ